MITEEYQCEKCHTVIEKGRVKLRANQDTYGTSYFLICPECKADVVLIESPDVTLAGETAL